MNTSISLIVLNLFAFWIGSFLWQVAGSSQASAASYMIGEGLTFALIRFISIL